MASRNSSSASEGRPAARRSNGDSARWTGGLLLLCMGFYAASAVFFSFFSWASDQSGLKLSAEERLTLGVECDNPCGWSGARLARLLVDDAFGVCGIILPLLVVMAGIRIIRRRPLLVNHTFLSLLLVMILGSLTLGFAFSDRWSICCSTGWGGAFGIGTATLLRAHIGSFGTLILLAGGWILTGVFINRNFINTVNTAGNAVVDRSGRIVDMVRSKVAPGHVSDEPSPLQAEERSPRPQAVSGEEPRRGSAPVSDPVPAAAAEPRPDTDEVPSRSSERSPKRPSGEERSREEMRRERSDREEAREEVSEPLRREPAREIRHEAEEEPVRPSRRPVREPEEQSPFEELTPDGRPVEPEKPERPDVPEPVEEGPFTEVDLRPAEGRLVMGRGGLVELERPVRPVRAAAPVRERVADTAVEISDLSEPGQPARGSDDPDGIPARRDERGDRDFRELSGRDASDVESDLPHTIPARTGVRAGDPFAAPDRSGVYAEENEPFAVHGRGGSRTADDDGDFAGIPGADGRRAAEGDPFTEFVVGREEKSAGESDTAAGESDVLPAGEQGVVVTVEANRARMVAEDAIPEDLYDPLKDLVNYRKPPVTLLEDYASDSEVTDEEIYENKTKIEETLKNFGIPIQRIKATVGPTVTLYEIVQAQGVKIAKIQGLQNDIAQSLKAESGIRIIAPIPGRGTIGIEVPNRNKQVVSMYSAVRSQRFQESKAELPVVIGRTIQNENYVFDLAKLPHLLVAGATGMGKSVGLNAIITSLLYRKHPSQLKFVMIDPKMVEFSLYSKIERHFLAKMESEDEAVITDPKKAVYTLNALCTEMDSRLEMCKNAGARNIREYNDKFTARRLNPLKGHRFLPYIVVVIDEFADLIMMAKEVEAPVIRLAQKARAVGIHLIVATQRPSVDVITGKIKANFPSRIAFRVVQMIDSRTIIDQPGANQLIGRGDMLFSKDGLLTRIQCALVETEEVERIVDYISRQQGYTSAYALPDYTPDGGGDTAGGGSEEASAPVKYDSLFAEIAREAVESGSISTSMIQRNYEVGFNRAGRIMMQLERAGIVGRQQGAKPRDILFHDLLSLEAKLQELGLS